MSEQRANWPQIGDIIPNHDGGRPPATDRLVGLQLSLGGAEPIDLRFSADRCHWREVDGESEFEYEAFALGSQLFFVDMMPVRPDLTSRTAIIDFGESRALIVELTFPTPDEAKLAVLGRLAATGSQSAVKVRYRQSPIGTAPVRLFERSRSLVGKHLRYTYSTTHVYDHFHHSERFYSWFCREGPDKDLGDFEECDTFELAPKLFLICWREKLLPCVGILAENHASMRMIGKICGVDAYTGAIGNTRVGGSIRLIAEVPGN
jgi:MoaF C-terminal domain/MoaF N-terminal domain